MVTNMGCKGAFTAMLIVCVLSTVASGNELKLNYFDPGAVEHALNLLQKQDSLPALADDLPGQKPSVTMKALTILSDHNLKKSLDALITSKDLVLDVMSPKSIIVDLGGDDSVEHVDFVGLVRGRDEALPAPDAVSTFVIRVEKGGKLSVIQRKPDISVDLNSMKFSFEK